MPGKGVQPCIELDLARGPIMPHDQTAVVVEQHFLGDPAKAVERALQPGKPAFLPLVAKGPDIDPPRITKRGDKQVDLDVRAADQHPAFAKIDL